MFRVVGGMLTILALVGSFTSAQEKSAPDPADVEVLFLNGSLIRMIVLSDKLEIATDYGKLTVPIKDVRSIEFGLRFPEGVQERIRGAITDLGGSDYKAREAAVKTLVELAPYSYPSALESMRSKEVEVSRRAKDVVKQIEKKIPKKDLKISDQDKVVTKSFPISGRILTASLKSKTELFGEVELSLAKMGTLKSMANFTASDITVTVDAATYANAGQWLETGVEVDGRSALTISAKGMVDTWPQQPGQYICGPNGAGQGGGRMFINGVVVGGGFGGAQGGAAGQALMRANGGALFGKVGDGDPFLIGERYSNTPQGEGKLFLAIAPSPWQCASSGNFEVKISR